MNILFLCDEYPPGRHGGIGSVVQMQARAMVAEGHKVVVAGFYEWGYGEQDAFNDNGVLVFRFRRGLSSNIFRKTDSFFVRGAYRLLKDTRILEWDIRRSLKRYSAFLEMLIKKYSIDIVEMPDYNDYVRFCKSVVPFPRLSVPTIVKLHGSLTYIFRQNNQTVPENIFLMEKSILHQADAVSGVSKYVADNSAKYFGYDKQISVLYNGIDVGHASSELQTKDPKLVAFAGSLTENKGIYQLMKAWNIVYREMPDARLAVMGKGPVADIQSSLEAAALPSVVFHGHVGRADLLQVFEKATVGVFPSFAESFALVPMEAMVNAVAVVYTKRTSGPELIDDGVDGLLAEPSDEQEIAAKILLLLKDVELRQRLANAGQTKILKHFSIENVVHENVRFYNKVITR